MKRRAHLRADPDKVRAWVQRSRKRLPAESPKRVAERATRRAVVAEASDRDGPGCWARERVPEVTCWGPLEPHEVVPRGRRPGSHLDATVVHSCCSAHHRWAHEAPDELVVERGMLLHDWS